MLDVVLQITHERANIKQVKLGAKTTIGRGGECNLKIASGEISRRHCQLTVDDTRVLVCDLGSSNGTYLNGKLIPANQEIELTPGSRLTIGPLKCVVQFTSPAAVVVPPADHTVLSDITVVATPEQADNTNNADADFTFSESPGSAQADKVAVPGKGVPDTELEMDLEADARKAAQQAKGKTSEPQPDPIANAEAVETPPAEDATEFMFKPDAATLPNALVAPSGDTPSFDAWNESTASELAIPMEPMTIPAPKKKKSFFDFFSRKSKEPVTAESSPAPIANEPEPMTTDAVTQDAMSPDASPEFPAPGESVPVAAVPTPVPEPEPVVVPAAPAAASPGDAEDIEPFWS